MVQGQEIVGEAGEVRSVHEQATDGQDGLVVRLGRISECSESPRFVDEADAWVRLSTSTLTSHRPPIFRQRSALVG